MVLNKRGREDNLYKQLQERTLERLEQLCGKKWTDYNAHDPGITIADYFNYGLFELSYRLGSAFETYLIQPGEKAVAFAQKGLLPKEELFSPSIITIEDYEHLLVSSIPDIKKIRVRHNNNTKLYDIFFTLKEDNDALHKEQVVEQIRKLYHSNRNLCENLGSIIYGFPVIDDVKAYSDKRQVKKDVYEYPSFDVAALEDTPNVPFSSAYQSIQFDFPETYGIGERGLPSGAYNADTFKILQLKAYLLIFDHLLADTLKQAGNSNELLEFSGHIPHNLITDVIVPEVEKIVDNDKKTGSYLHTNDYYNKQKSLYLNMLDTLYGEDTSHIFRHEHGISGQEVNERRAGLIRKLPGLNAARFQSFNIYDAESIPVIAHIIEALTDHYTEVASPDTFGKYGLRIISDSEFYDKYRFLQNTGFNIDIEENTHLLDIAETDVVYDDKAFHKLRMNINLLWYNVLFTSFVKYGDDKRFYRILPLPENEYLLVFRHPGQDNWINMGLFFSTVEKLTETANLLWQFIRRIRHREVHTRYYFIEHLLLDNGHGEDRDKLSVVVHADSKDRDHVETLLDERLPAHIKISVLYVGAESLQQFEHIYRNWRKALALGSKEGTDYASIAVRAFLSSNVHHSKRI